MWRFYDFYESRNRIQNNSSVRFVISAALQLKILRMERGNYGHFISVQCNDLPTALSSTAGPKDHRLDQTCLAPASTSQLNGASGLFGVCDLKYSLGNESQSIGKKHF